MNDNDRQKTLILEIQERNRRLVEQNIELQNQNETLKRQAQKALKILRGN